MKDKKIIVITGANSSIGKVTSIECAKQQDTIIMVCRNETRGQKALEEIKRLSGNEDIHLMLCDLSSFESVKNFANDFKTQFKHLDILIHNAGIMEQKREISCDGFEMHLQVNYLSPYLLTMLLLDVIQPHGRIITVASLAHRMGKIHFDDLNLKHHFSMFKAYSQSKLALLLFSYELAKRLKDQHITINSLHPGIIISNLGIYQNKKVIKLLINRLKWIFTSTKKGAETTVYLATSPLVEDVTGRYFTNKKPVKSSKLSYDVDLSLKLWNKTKDLLNL